MEKQVTLFTLFGDHRVAVLTISIIETGLGAMDPDSERQPTLQEMDDIATKLIGRDWKFSKND